MRKNRIFHLLLVCGLIAVSLRLFKPSPEPLDNPKTNTHRVSANSSHKLEGSFTWSTDYFGHTLTLKDDEYEENFFSCTDRGNVSQGSYRFDGTTLTLINSKTGEPRTLHLLSDGLLEYDSEDNTITDYVRSGSDRRSRAKFTAPPEFDSSTLARGKKIFESQCASCHGDTGNGIPSNDLGYEPPPTNLTDLKNFRHGHDVLSINDRISHGVEGTAMAPYLGVLDADEIWTVSQYVMDLSGREPELPWGDLLNEATPTTP